MLKTLDCLRTELIETLSLVDPNISREWCPGGGQLLKDEHLREHDSSLFELQVFISNILLVLQSMEIPFAAIAVPPLHLQLIVNSLEKSEKFEGLRVLVLDPHSQFGGWTCGGLFFLL